MPSMFPWLKPHPLIRLEKQRQALLEQQPDKIIRDILNQPLAEKDDDARRLDYLVVDFETSGFDASRDQVVSIGWVEIRQGVIELSRARHCLIRNGEEVNASAARIHHLLPETLRWGYDVRDGFSRLLSEMPGKVLIAHGAAIEKRFLSAYVNRYYGLDALPLVWLDTLRIEQYRRRRGQTRPDWRLASVRRQYHLPSYPAHHVLTDALATAELYLAQLHGLFACEPATFGVLVAASE